MQFHSPIECFATVGEISSRVEYVLLQSARFHPGLNVLLQMASLTYSSADENVSSGDEIGF